MAMKKCPRCGERYSDTYKTCPFCEEEENDGRYSRGRRGEREGGHGFIGVILVIVAVLVILGVGWSLFGQQIKDTFFAEKPSQSQNGGQDTVDPDNTDNNDQEPVTDPDGAVKPDVNDGEDGENDTDVDTTTPVSGAVAVVIDKEDFTLNAGETYTLTVSGGDGENYSFDVENSAVAKVDSKGTVTGVANGNTTVTVTSGGKTAECIVRVKGGTAAAGGSTTTTTAAALNKEDITMKVGETFSLSVGTSATWSSDKTSVATVDANGKVTAAASGMANVTATLSNGTKLTCIIRVK